MQYNNAPNVTFLTVSSSQKLSEHVQLLITLSAAVNLIFNRD